MKKSLLIAALALGTLAANAEIVGGINYTLNSATKTAEITKTFEITYTGDLVVPSTITVSGTTYTVTSLGIEAFKSSELTSIVLPNTVTTLNRYAFNGSALLKTITLGTGVTDIKANMIDGCTSLTDIYINSSQAFSVSGATFTQASAIRANTNLHFASKAMIKNFLDAGGWNSFKMYMYPDMVCIDGVYYLANPADNTAKMLATYDVAATDLGISQSALSGNAQQLGPDVNVAGTITVGGKEYTVTTLQAGAFYDTPNVTSVTFNEGLSNVEYETFYGTKVSEVVFPNSLENLEHSNFYYCPNLTKVTFGTGFKTIGNNCFTNCAKLTDITCLATVPPTQAAGTSGNVFTAAVKSAVTLTVPYGTADLYKASPVWSGFKAYVELPQGPGVGIEGVEVNQDAPARYFSLQGVEINEPVKGQMVIEVRGGKSVKRVIR